MTNPPSSETLWLTETLEIENGVSLVPRVKLLLTIHCADHSIKPLDEWQLKRSLTDFLKSSFSLIVLEDGIIVRRFKDLKKRKHDDPVAHGALFIRDLGFLSKLSISEILHVPKSDDFDGMRKEWEELNAFGNRGYSRGGRPQQPDTIVLKGVPSH
ncbi:hypothetical protein ACSBR1_003907 [Camellia fascicularis]